MTAPARPATPTRRRITTLALLLILPLTLAPRTSWTIEGVMYDLAPASPRETVRPRSAVPLNLMLKSRSDDPIVAKVVIDAAVDGAKDAVRIASASRGCEVEGPRVTCTVNVAPRGTPTVTVVARPLVKGRLTFAVTEGFGREEFVTVAVDVVAPRRGGATRR